MVELYLYCGFLPRLAQGRMCAYPSLQGCIINCGENRWFVCLNPFAMNTILACTATGSSELEGRVGMLCDKEDLAALLSLDCSRDGNYELEKCALIYIFSSNFMKYF